MSELTKEMGAARQRWGSDTSTEAAWDANRLVTKVRKAGMNEEAMAFANDALEVWPDFGPLRGGLSWCLFDRYVKTLDEHSTPDDRGAAKQAVDSIADLNAAGPYEKFSAWPIATIVLISKVCDHWPKRAIELLSTIDPRQLSDTRSNGFDSLRSRWFLMMTKALTKTDQWSEVLPACQDALANGGLDRKGQGLVEHRRCKALLGLGRADEAVEDLKELSQRLKEWYIDSDLADAYAKTGNHIEAIAAARRALGFPVPGPLPLAPSI